MKGVRRGFGGMIALAAIIQHNADTHVAAVRKHRSAF
jgi:hypothetical protein